MRFHLLGLAHVPTRKDISACAYTQKIRRLSPMLLSLGHEVYFYGVENSEVDCTEYIPLLSLKEHKDIYGDQNPTSGNNQGFFVFNGNDPAYTLFNKRAIDEINRRKENTDVLLVSMGTYQQPISVGTGMMTVESGIGYYGTFARKRIFESYAWMHHIYGWQKDSLGTWYDDVIPNYFTPEEYPFKIKKKDYILYIGRLIENKGVSIAVDVARKLGLPLKVAGQGNPDHFKIAKDEYVGVVGPDERGELMSNAKVVIAPTWYIEPFGGVAVESMMCGTPIITTDWGAFPETVIHGKTGFRCRTMNEFVEAVKNIDTIKPSDCRKHAISKYSTDVVKYQYDTYFKRIADLWKGGWYEIREET